MGGLLRRDPSGGRSLRRSRARLAAALALLASGPVFGARTAVRSYTTGDGLPQSQVTALCQDRQGVIWLGTQAGGVGRYDGQRWERYDVSSGLATGAVTGIVIGDDGRPIAGTSGGVARFDGSGWVPVALPGEPLRTIVRALTRDDAGRLWVGTETGLVVIPVVGPATPVPGATPELSRVSVSSLAPDGAGGLWVGTENGLARVSDPASPRLVAAPGLPPGSVSALLLRPAGQLLAAVSNAGLFEGRSPQFRRVGDDAAPGRRVFTLAEETAGDGAVWIGTGDKGAFRLSGETFEAFGPEQGLLHRVVYAIFEDREGVLWFGTEGGLTKRGPSAFVTYSNEDGFPEGEAVYGMAETSDGTIWLTAGSGGLVSLTRSGKLRRIAVADGTTVEPTLDVTVDRDDVLWIATRTGLYRLRGGRAEKVPIWPAGSEHRVFTLLARPDGRVLVGTRGAGVKVLSAGSLQPLDGPFGPNVSALAAQADGTIWGGGDGWGVVGVAPGKPPVVLTVKNGLPSNQVNGLFVDSDGTLWISTAGGAVARDLRGALRVVDRRDGLPESFVYWVGEDREKGLWFGTNRGAARRDPSGAIDVFTARDGLGSDECNEDGFLLDSAGRVWVGTMGVSRFLGRPRPRRAVPPEILVDRVLVDGRERPDLEGARLPPDPGPITFRFAAPTYTDENAVRFRYRLLGLSDAWSETGPGQAETTYGGLGPGRYVFEASVRTGDGRTAKSPARVAFAVRPVWWRTWTALATVLLGVGGLGVAVVRFRVRRLVEARLALEREVAQRTDELRRANERLETLAVTDDLTGLSNRRRILERLHESLAYARRQGTPLSIALADLDRFKEVNDGLGHAAGDRLLAQVARALNQTLRTEDLIGRYGGEEFLAVLPGSDGPGAVAVAERLRQAVENLALPNEVDWTGGFATLSVGVATLDPGVVNAAELIRRADEALYRAKDGGRNRVVPWV